MPLTLRPPRSGKTPNYEIRGTYLGITVERSARTPDKKLAQRQLRALKAAIERGEYQAQVVAGTRPTFLSAAVAYLKAGGEAKFLGPILEMAGEHALRDKALAEIDQMAIDNAATALYPDATPQTRNRQFYTPVSYVLKRAGIEKQIKRPKGWRGKKSKSSFLPDQAFAVCAAADAMDAEFGLLCWMLLYTGMRISEPLNAPLRHLQLDRRDAAGRPEAALYLDDPKNDEPRMAYLTPFVVAKFRAMPPRLARPSKATASRALSRGEPGRSQIDAGVPFLKRGPDAKLFRFHYGSHLRKLLAKAMKIAGISFPPRQRGFHLFCHSYGTWMTNFGGLDNYGLTRTKRWKDPRSAEVYVHTKINAEARRADVLPLPPIRGKSGGTHKKKS